ICSEVPIETEFDGDPRGRATRIVAEILPESLTVRTPVPSSSMPSLALSTDLHAAPGGTH
ncbi:MAG: hypothetical protein WBA46_11620, partial [Thermomicrobiales bacterium]